MQAAVIETPGRPPGVHEREAPPAAPGELLVAVAGAPITPLDRLCASGTSYFGSPQVPYVPGVQGVGVVERGSAAIPAGTPVWFASSAGMRPGDGSMRGFATVTEDDVVPLDTEADVGLVAALGLSAVAAWMALTWRGELVAGEHVLVLGGGGVVGQAAVQLARTAGAGRVVAAARSERAREHALRLGADQVVALADGYAGAEDVAGLAERLRAACDGPVDLVLDPLFGVPAAAALRTLRPGGQLVNVGGSAGETAPFDTSTLRSRSLRVLGYTNNELSTEQRREALDRVVAEIIAGRLTVPHQRVPLGEVAQAWERTADGRVVLVP